MRPLLSSILISSRADPADHSVLSLSWLRSSLEVPREILFVIEKRPMASALVNVLSRLIGSVRTFVLNFETQLSSCYLNDVSDKNLENHVRINIAIDPLHSFVECDPTLVSITETLVLSHTRLIKN